MTQAHHKKHHHASPAYVDAFIAKVLPNARSTKLKWGVPVAVLIAQAAQETGWGRHVIDNAYFGIKGKAPDGSSVDFGTSEVVNGKVIHEKDAFRAYTGLADSADDWKISQSEHPLSIRD